MKQIQINYFAKSDELGALILSFNLGAPVGVEGGGFDGEDTKASFGTLRVILRLVWAAVRSSRFLLSFIRLP